MATTINTNGTNNGTSKGTTMNTMAILERLALIGQGVKTGMEEATNPTAVKIYEGLRESTRKTYAKIRHDQFAGQQAEKELSTLLLAYNAANQRGIATVARLDLMSLINDVQESVVAMSKATENKTHNATVQGVGRKIVTPVTGGADGAETRIRQLETVARITAEHTFSMLIYDIPESLNDECPNPSHLLWHYGFRLNKSCWVLTEQGLAARQVQQLLADWAIFDGKRQYTNDEGVTLTDPRRVEVHIIPYAKEANEQVRAIARQKLEDELRRVHTSLIERLESASRRMDEAKKALDESETPALVSQTDYDRVETTRDNTVRGILKVSAEALSAAIDCAEMFDETENVRDLLQGLREAIRAEQASFNALMLSKGRKRSTVTV